MDMGVLRRADSYGDELDLSGPRVSPMVKATVKNLIHAGYLSGTTKNISLTDKGKRELQQ